MTSNLKDCPFCNSDNLTIRQKTRSNYNYYYGIKIPTITLSVRCNHCHARGGTVSGDVLPQNFNHNVLRKRDKGKFTSMAELKNKAIDLWNKRGGKI